MAKTIGELSEEARKRAGAKEYKGHRFMDLVQFDEKVRHMIVFDVLSFSAGVGERGDRMRLYLTDKGYENAKEIAGKGCIKILSHARVAEGRLIYGSREQVR